MITMSVRPQMKECTSFSTLASPLINQTNSRIRLINGFDGLSVSKYYRTLHITGMNGDEVKLNEVKLIEREENDVKRNEDTCN